MRPLPAPLPALSLVLALTLSAGVAPGQATTPPQRPTRQAPTAPKPVKPPARPTTPASTPATTPAPGAKPAQPKAKQAPAEGPYVIRADPRDLLFTARVRVRTDSPNEAQTYRDPFSGQTVRMPVIRPFAFETLSVVFPVLISTASAQVTGEVTGVLRLNDAVVSEKPTMLEGYPGPVRLARFDATAPGQGGAAAPQARQMELTITVPTRASNTQFKEDEAVKVGWPKDAWPPEAAALLKPQLYVEQGIDAKGLVRPYEDKVLQGVLESWLAKPGAREGPDRSPVLMAKMLTAEVWGAVQVRGEGLHPSRTGEMAGLDLQPPARTLELGRGSEHDVTVLLAALMRRAGLPTRTVIGFDVGEGNDRFLESSQRNRLRSWVEFALYDEAKNTLNWVPVDIASLRKSSSRPPRERDRAWRYFGTHDELNGVTPFALQFHPPTDVVSYGVPGFWGWFVTPKPPGEAQQFLAFSATAASVRPAPPEPRKGR